MIIARAAPNSDALKASHFKSGRTYNRPIINYIGAVARFAWPLSPCIRNFLSLGRSDKRVTSWGLVDLLSLEESF